MVAFLLWQQLCALMLKGKIDKIFSLIKQMIKLDVIMLVVCLLGLIAQHLEVHLLLLKSHSIGHSKSDAEAKADCDRSLLARRRRSYLQMTCWSRMLLPR